MDLAGGAFRAEPEMNSQLSSAFTQSRQLSIEIVVTPDGIDMSCPSHIVSYGRTYQEWSFALVLQNDELLAGPGPSATGKQRLLHLTKVVAHRPYHVVLTQRRGTITAFVDGDQIVVREAPFWILRSGKGVNCRSVKLRTVRGIGPGAQKE